MKRAILLAIALTGCTHLADPRFTAHVIPQDDAPVQIVSIAPSRDNLLGHVVVKNTTDKPVLNFDIAWTIIIPKNCSSNRSGPIRGYQATQTGYAGGRPLEPHGQTGQVIPPWVTLESLTKIAEGSGAQRIRVQVWIAYVDYAPPEAVKGLAFTHIGPDWREEKFAGYIPDAADAEGQACTGA